MLEATPLSIQISAAREDPLRVLVVGAGVAGASVAQLLRGDRLHPVLVERDSPGAGHGYMLALMPMVDPVIDELGIRETYLESSVGLQRYRFLAHTGRKVREDSMEDVLKQFGDYRGISRGQLLQALTSGGGTISYDTTVTGIRQSASEVAVTLSSDGEQIEAEFDLVIAADGLHSATRGLVLDSRQVETVDTGWGGWVDWAPTDGDLDLGEELWGAGFFVGSYPVKNQIGVIVGGPRSDTRVGPARFVEGIRNTLKASDQRLSLVLDVAARSADAYYWPLTDCRSATWSVGRVVLLGDAAAGFLPTAGIGAGMAMESAGVLAGHLRQSSSGDLPPVLRRYEAAQRPRVQAAQDTSRRLAHLMFRRSRAVAAVRDVAASFVSVDMALGPIKKLLCTPPVPTTGRVPKQERRG